MNSVIDSRYRPLLVAILGLVLVYALEYMLNVRFQMHNLAVLYQSGFIFQLLLLVFSAGYLHYFNTSLLYSTVSLSDIKDALIWLFVVLFSVYLLLSFVGVSNTASVGTRGYTLLAVGVSVFLAPVVEEIFYRGILFEQLDDVASATIASVVSSIIFAGSHLFSALHGSTALIGVVLIITPFISGLYFAWLYHSTNNILAPIVFHSLYNLVMI